MPAKNLAYFTRLRNEEYLRELINIIYQNISLCPLSREPKKETNIEKLIRERNFSRLRREYDLIFSSI